MALHWSITDEERLVIATAEGEVSALEVAAFFDMLDQTGLHSWRKLFNAERADAWMGSDDVMAMVVRIRESHQRFEIGPLAIVAQQNKIELCTRTLGTLAAANRPMRMFGDLETARTWLLRQPLSSRKRRRTRPPRPWVKT